MRSGSPPTLWWLLIVADGPVTDTDSLQADERAYTVIDVHDQVADLEISEV